MTVSGFLEQRFKLLIRGDYAGVYQTYHPEAPVAAQFVDGDDYDAYAREFLREIKVLSWRCLDQRQLAADRVECLLVMDLIVAGQRQTFCECALLIRIGEGWFYHSAMKLDPNGYSGRVENLRFEDFDALADSIRF